jgi:branched-chain amino acid transport system ATP-binding protein
MAPILRIEGISKSFGGLIILRSISLKVEEGEHVAIIGPNGAGKTTLLNVITGELPWTGGQIYVSGQEITNMATHQRVHMGLARSFQISRLFPNLTVLDNMLLAIYGLRHSRFQMFRSAIAYDEVVAKAHYLLKLVDLFEKRRDLVRNVSYGEQRELEIILSLASEPKLLLLDEPTAGLAIAEVAGFTNMIKTLAKDTATVFTAHDMDVVFDLADRVLVLYFGQIIAQGTPREIQGNARVREIYLGTEGNGADVRRS